MADRLQILIDIQSRLEGLDKAVAQTAQLNALSRDSVATARQQQVIEEQTRAIALNKFELVASQVAGDQTRVKLLRDELAIRGATLGTLRATAFTSAELTAALASQNLLLQTAGLKAEGMAAATALSERQLNKARSSAGALTQALISGNLTAQGLGTTLASVSGTLSIAAIAGYGLYSIIVQSGDAALELAKNAAKQEVELSKAVDEWLELARAAKDFGDTVKIADKATLELNRLAASMAEFRAKQLTEWGGWADSIESLIRRGLNTALSRLPGYGGLGIDPQTSAATAANAEAVASKERYERAVRSANAALDISIDTENEWAAAQADLGQGIEDFTAKVNKLGGELADLDAKRRDNTADAETLRAYTEKAELYELAKDRLTELTREQEKLNKSESASGRREYNSALREQRDLLRELRDQVQAIASDPFTLQGEKNSALIRGLQAEAEQLRLTGHEWEAYAKERQAAALSPTGQLQAELTQFANSFGTSSQQAAGVITGTLNTAIQQTSQLLTDAIFRTGDWKAALIAVGEAGVQSLIEMGIQLVIQHALGEALKGASTATSVAQGTAIATAQAPAAAATSISSFGTSAVVGGALALAAIGAIIAALSGGFARGGRTGRGPKIATVGEEGEEFVFTAAATRNLGIDRLYAQMHRAERGYAGGGMVEDPDLPSSDEPYYGVASYGNTPFGPQVSVPRSTPPSVTIIGGTPSANVGGTGIRDFGGLGGGWGGIGGPAGNTGFGSFAPGSYGPGAGPTAIPTYWGPSNGISAGPTSWFNAPTSSGLPYGPHGRREEFAAGGRLAGGPSNTDSIPAMLAPGEYVINSFAARRIGYDRLDALNRVHMAAGGRAGYSSGGSGGSAQVHVYNFTDQDALLRHLSGTRGQKILIDVVNGRRIDLGFPS